MSVKQPMRYAHSEGHTDVCFDESGKYMLTGGDDGDVRIWEGIEGDDTATHIGNKVYAVVCTNGRFYTANDMNSIQAYTFPDCSPDGIVARFTAPVLQMSLNSDRKKLAAGASDFTIKVIDLEESMSKSYLGHDAPVLSVVIDTRDEYLASSSCDGTVRVWRLDDQSLVKTLTLLSKSSDFSLTKSLCRLAWDQQSGENLVVPVATGVEVYSRRDWSKVETLTDSHIKQDISILSFTSCGRYLAVACRDGAIVVWDWSTKVVAVRTGHDRGHTITALCWNPRTDLRQLAFADNQGQLCVISDVLPPCSTLLAGSAGEGVGETVTDVFGDDEDFVLAADPNKRDLDSDDDGMSDIIGRTRKIADIDDDASEKSSMISDVAKTSNIASVAPVVPPFAGPKPTPLQSPFQPSSTPEHLTNRFMKWNAVGVIRQYNTDDERSIDVEFHDAAVHHALHLANPRGYAMADLSTDAVLLASSGDHDETDSDAASRLQCLHFASWDNCREWGVDMPEGEEIVAVVVGGSWVGAATDLRYVRLYTITGVQLGIICVPGPVVCMAAFTDFLLVIYHRAMGIPGDQCLGSQLINVKGEGRHADLIDLPLPLSPKSTLSWAGFSVQGTPFTCDSVGVVRMLNRRLNNTWTPVANTKKHTKGQSDHYWIVGISENPQQIRCIPCKGARYPPTLPRPAVAVLPLEIPLCELHAEKSQYEEVYHRSRLLADHLDHWSSLGYDIDNSTKVDLMKPAQESIMKLFALSVRSEREYRAVELCEMMDGEHTLQLAIKYATRLKRLQLAQRIAELARDRAEQQEDQDNGVSLRHEEQGESSSQNGVGESCAGESQDVIPPTLPGPTLKVGAKKSSASSTASPAAASASNWSNPFKLVSQEQSHTVFKGSQVFDEMARTANRPTPAPNTPTLASVRKTHLPKKNQGKLFAVSKSSPTANSATNQDENIKQASELLIQNQVRQLQMCKPASAFDLWLCDNEGDLRIEMPRLNEEDLHAAAMERFQQLSRDEKQVYLQKARTAKNSDKTSKDLENKKRKREGEINTTADGHEPNVAQKKIKNDTADVNECGNEGKDPLTLSTNDKLSTFSFNKSN